MKIGDRMTIMCPDCGKERGFDVVIKNDDYFTAGCSSCRIPYEGQWEFCKEKFTDQEEFPVFNYRENDEGDELLMSIVVKEEIRFSIDWRPLTERPPVKIYPKGTFVVPCWRCQQETHEDCPACDGTGKTIYEEITSASAEKLLRYIYKP